MWPVERLPPPNATALLQVLFRLKALRDMHGGGYDPEGLRRAPYRTWPRAQGWACKRCPRRRQTQPWLCLSRPSIETLRWQDAKLQDLRPALCLSRRPAERECRLQAEDGPLDSGCHHPGLSGTGCALPVQVESSLYEKCSVLLGAGSWRLTDRYL